MIVLKKILTWILIFVFSMGIVLADAEQLAAAKKLIDAKTPCSKMTEGQLEIIGDYFMERIHPGESHTAMEQMMGGEGSESLRLMHIAMAKRIYCNDLNGTVNYGMMGYGMMYAGRGTNYGGMMNMMGYNSGYGYSYLTFFNILAIILAVGLVILVYMWIFKLWRELSKKSR